MILCVHTALYNDITTDDLVNLCVTTCIIDFAKLRAYYHTILDLMPDNYEITTGKLQNYISDDQVCAILGASNSTLANKIILHCLIKRISCPAELLDMCDQLESVITSHNLRIITNDIRIG